MSEPIQPLPGGLCPVCRADIEMDEPIPWESCTGGRGVMLGRWSCPNGCDPRSVR